MAYSSVLPPDTTVTPWCLWLAFMVLQDAPQHIGLGHTVTLEGVPQFLSPLPPWALLSLIATLTKQDHAQGSSSSGDRGRALERAG